MVNGGSPPPPPLPPGGRERLKDLAPIDQPAAAEELLMIADAQTFQEQLQEIETAAVKLAWGAGRILSAQFGRQLSIEYKDKNRLDPVTSADKSTQEYLVRELYPPLPVPRHPGGRGFRRDGLARPGAGFPVGAGPAGRHHQLSERAARLRLVHWHPAPGTARRRSVVHPLALARRRVCAALSQGWWFTLYVIGRRRR